jgi:hypothetical protein
MGWYGLHSSSLRWKPVEGSCEHGNEPLDSVKCLEIYERLVASQNNSDPWSLLVGQSAIQSLGLVTFSLLHGLHNISL